jgi:hypothetical protein
LLTRLKERQASSGCYFDDHSCVRKFEKLRSDRTTEGVVDIRDMPPSSKLACEDLGGSLASICNWERNRESTARLNASRERVRGVLSAQDAL